VLSNTGKRETSGWSDGSERRRRLNRSVSFVKVKLPKALSRNRSDRRPRRRGADTTADFDDIKCAAAAARLIDF
jgi:hypothetical protein